MTPGWGTYPYEAISIAIKLDCNQVSCNHTQLRSNQLQSHFIGIINSCNQDSIALKLSCNQGLVANQSQLQSRVNCNQNMSCNQDSVKTTAIKALFESWFQLSLIAIESWFQSSLDCNRFWLQLSLIAVESLDCNCYWVHLIWLVSSLIAITFDCNRDDCRWTCSILTTLSLSNLYTTGPSIETGCQKCVWKFPLLLFPPYTRASGSWSRSKQNQFSWVISGKQAARTKK